MGIWAQSWSSFTAEERINADYTQKFARKAAAPRSFARNQGPAGCSAKGADAERGVETIESDDEVGRDDEADVGDDEVVELRTV